MTNKHKGSDFEAYMALYPNEAALVKEIEELEHRIQELEKIIKALQEKIDK